VRAAESCRTFSGCETLVDQAGIFLALSGDDGLRESMLTMQKGGKSNNF
jgi:hypothetical protein